MAKRPFPRLRPRRVRPSKEEIAEARSTRKWALLCFQASLLWLLVQIGVVVATILRGDDLSPLMLAGLLAVGIALGMFAGRRYRIPFLFVGAGTALPGALLPPVLISTVTCFGIVLLGYAGHVISCWLQGRDVTAPPPREADAPSEVVRAQAERSIPGRENVKAVPAARLIPKLGRRWR